VARRDKSRRRTMAARSLSRDVTLSLLEELAIRFCLVDAPVFVDAIAASCV
jgi:hypothetical protein